VRAARAAFIVACAAAIAATICAAVSIGGCGPRRRSPNLIVLVIDALRADRLSCYGNPHPTSPAIDAVAAEGVLFEQAMAQCSFTPPAMASILTGRYVPSHGLLGWESRLAPAETTLADVVAGAGYRSAAFVYLNLLTRHGLSDGFGEGEEMVEGAERLTALAKAWIEKDRATPFFLLLHCYDVHRPYTPPAPYDTLFDPAYAGTIDGGNETIDAVNSGARAISPEDARHLAALYDGEIRCVDDTLGRFFAWLRETGLVDETVLVITSDHGEMLAERDAPRLRYTHDPSLYDGVMRIPLIVRGPGVPRGVRAGAQVREIDIMPTALDLLDIDVPASVQGVSLFDAEGAARSEPLPAYADVYPEPTRPERYLRALRVSGMKVIHNLTHGTWEKYDLAADPSESRNVWAGPPDSLRSALLAHAVDMGEVHELCVAWVGREGETLTGALQLRGGKIVRVDHPPASARPHLEVSADTTAAAFGGAAGSTPSVIWFRVHPPDAVAEIAMRDAAGNALPIAIYGRGEPSRGSVTVSMPDIGHALLFPFDAPPRGSFVYARARREKQRVSISLGPEEIERLRALGYIGDAGADRVGVSGAAPTAPPTR
jgi:arylsulfatase A-like enzyme